MEDGAGQGADGEGCGGALKQRGAGLQAIERRQGCKIMWKIMSKEADARGHMHPPRLERGTFAFGGQRSIQLSYGCGKGV